MQETFIVYFLLICNSGSIIRIVPEFILTSAL